MCACTHTHTHTSSSSLSFSPFLCVPPFARQAKLIEQERSGAAAYAKVARVITDKHGLDVFNQRYRTINSMCTVHHRSHHSHHSGTNSTDGDAAERLPGAVPSDAAAVGTATTAMTSTGPVHDATSAPSASSTITSDGDGSGDGTKTSGTLGVQDRQEDSGDDCEWFWQADMFEVREYANEPGRVHQPGNYVKYDKDTIHTVEEHYQAWLQVKPPPPTHTHTHTQTNIHA